jgi:hypothetical protein
MNWKTWWDEEGSAMRNLPDEDFEEFARRITQIAWSNGAYKEREACAKVCEELPPVGESKQWERATLKDCAAAIRARGEQT